MSLQIPSVSRYIKHQKSLVVSQSPKELTAGGQVDFDGFEFFAVNKAECCFYIGFSVSQCKKFGFESMRSNEHSGYPSNQVHVKL